MGEKAARPRSLKFDLRVKVDKCVCVCLCASEKGSVTAHTFASARALGAYGVKLSCCGVGVGTSPFLCGLFEKVAGLPPSVAPNCFGTSRVPIVVSSLASVFCFCLACLLLLLLLFNLVL